MASTYTALRLRVLAARLTSTSDVTVSASVEGGSTTTITVPPARIRFGLLWTLIGFLVLLLEGVALGRPAAGDALSEWMRVVRFDLVGRFVLIPLIAWLNWHWILRPQSMLGITWRDFVAVGIGALYAAWETWR